MYKQIEEYIDKTGKLPTTKHGGTGRAKKYLIKVQGHKCSICKRKTWRGKLIPLIFDHIDGNRTNWSFNNCRLICPNCDHQLPTFAGRNIKNKNESVRSKSRKNRYYILKKTQKFGERINY